MKTFICRILILAALTFGLSCQSSPAPKMDPVIHDPVIAKAGWKIGQVYRALKRGGVSNEAEGYFSLDTEIGNSRVAEAWRNPEYRSRYLAYKVVPGTLFQAVEVRYSRYSGCYSVWAVQLPANPVRGRIAIDMFSGEESPILRGVDRRTIFKRDPNYLVPVEMPMDSGNQTTNAIAAP